MNFSSHWFSIAVFSLGLFVLSENTIAADKPVDTPTASSIVDSASAKEGLQVQLAGVEAQLADSSLGKSEQKSLKKQKKQLEKDLKSIAKNEKKAKKAIEKEKKKLLAKNKKLYGDGPYPEQINAYIVTKPQDLQPFYRSLYVEGERNSVLNFDRLGLAAIETGHFDTAEWAFDNSLDRIEAIYADNPAAKKAKSKFAKESTKPFKGEPYERSMAFYYRGVLYLREGDYENARASFISAEFQDTMSEHEEFKADFALLNYLSGWSSQCNKNMSMADEFYVIAKQHNPLLTTPPRTDNTLVIGELGLPPVKVGEGKHNEILKFQPNLAYGETGVVFVVQDANGEVQEESGVTASSVYEQATTRGGRAIDGLLEGKAQFKDGMSATGDVLATVGVSTMAMGLASGSDNMAGLGAVVGLFGLIAKASANAAKPESDIRYWDSLPDLITIQTMQTDGLGSASVVTRFKGQGKVPDEPAALKTVDAGNCSLAWVRSRSALAVPESAPNARLSAKESKKQKKAIVNVDTAFRSYLETSEQEITL